MANNHQEKILTETALTTTYWAIKIRMAAVSGRMVLLDRIVASVVVKVMMATTRQIDQTLDSLILRNLQWLYLHRSLRLSCLEMI